MDDESSGGLEAPALETRRVYDAASVDGYIAGLESQLEAQQAEVLALRQHLDDAIRAITAAEEQSKSSIETEVLLGRALLTAQRTADEITSEAEQRAEVVLADARRQADDLLATARLQAAHVQAGRVGDEATGTNGGPNRVWRPSELQSRPTVVDEPAPSRTDRIPSAGDVWSHPSFGSEEASGSLVDLAGVDGHPWVAEPPHGNSDRAFDGGPFQPTDDPSGPTNGDADRR